MWPTTHPAHPDQYSGLRLSRPETEPAQPARGRLTLGTVCESGGLVVLRAAGEVDLGTAAVLEDHLNELLRRRCRTVALDLSGVSFLGVSGLNVLVAVRARALRQGAELRLAGCSHPVRRALDVSGLSCLFPPMPELVELVQAVAAVKHQSEAMTRQ